jgi:phosphopantothenoylcysteine decarboxylase/phosphopantothenate--cysteine ligase
MWEKAATQRNIEQLKKDGVRFVEPISGELACKTVGAGKLEDVENIVAQALKLLVQSPKSKVQSENEENTNNSNSETLDSGLRTLDLKGESFLITVGGTREAIDPVRFISNHSSGKMGFAIAAAAEKRGAKVTVVAGVTSVEPPENVNVIHAISAEEMHRAVLKELETATVFIGAAAVADYRPAKQAATKIKKSKDIMHLELEKTPDILSDVSKIKHSGLLVVGFAAETENVVEYARSKMQRKNLDLVVANDVTKNGAGFDSDTNIAIILRRGDEEKIELPLMSKREMADIILNEVIKLM